MKLKMRKLILVYKYKHYYKALNKKSAERLMQVQYYCWAPGMKLVKSLPSYKEGKYLIIQVPRFLINLLPKSVRW